MVLKINPKLHWNKTSFCRHVDFGGLILPSCCLVWAHAETFHQQKVICTKLKFIFLDIAPLPTFAIDAVRTSGM